jgi:hypothetical protein
VFVNHLTLRADDVRDAEPGAIVNVRPSGDVAHRPA